MDKVDQQPDTHHGEQHAEVDRQVGDKGDLISAADGAEDDQAVQEGSDEGTEYRLIRGVAHEIAEQTRTELR